MSRWRGRSWFVVGCALGLSLALPAGARSFRAADNQVESYPTVEALLEMDRLVRERTGGRHRVQVFHSRQLGEEKDTVEQTRVGAIDISRVNLAPLGHLSPLSRVMTLPFLFASQEHLDRVLDGPIGQEVLDSFGPAGLVGLAFYPSGARFLYNGVRPVRVPADMQGLRIRIQQSDVMSEFMLALGATPVALSYGQVLAGLEMKLIDGAENNWPSYVSTGHHSFARHVSMTEHVRTPEVVLMSLKAWEALSPDDREVFRAAARDSARFMRARWEVYEREMRDLAGSTTIPSAVDVDAFRAAAERVRDRYLEDPALRSLAERILALR